MNPNTRTLLICIGVILFFISTTNATCNLSVSTYTATSTDTQSVDISGNISIALDPTTVYLEYGAVNGSFLFRTPAKTYTPPQTWVETINGYPLIPGIVYYFRAVGTQSGCTKVYGNVENFTLNSPANTTNYNLDNHSATLFQEELTIRNTTIVSGQKYEDVMGTIGYGIILALLFAIYWIRMEDITVPTLLAIITGGTIISYLPESWKPIGNALLIIGVAGIFYIVLRGRNNT